MGLGLSSSVWVPFADACTRASTFSPQCLCQIVKRCNLNCIFVTQRGFWQIRKLNDRAAAMRNSNRVGKVATREFFKDPQGGFSRGEV